MHMRNRINAWGEMNQSARSLLETLELVTDDMEDGPVKTMLLKDIERTRDALSASYRALTGADD
jgi:cell division FtsZ-interacting protein ZapD